ncbi:MAG: lamin tail domain-containing protein [Deltaproteobacteria bacterium]|nr:lamin tail domain-containing protein [Deltaproteobacteria bacterium]
MKLRNLLGVVGVTCLVVSGCGQSSEPVEEQPGTDESGTVVQPGKEDNFLSPKAQEYQVEGTTTVTIESELSSATEEVKLARVKKLIPLKQVVIGWFLNQYLVAKESSSGNAGYGGFEALTKNGAYEELAITKVDDTTYKFTFRQEFAGSQDLLSKLPTKVGADGKRTFDLTIGKISNEDMARLETNFEWYRESPWSEFDPSKVDASRLDTVTLTVTAEQRSVDGWIDMNRLTADGKVTMGVHFGWDYHNNYHLLHSREIYDWLVNTQGFKSPVDSYDALTHTSGPLTKTIQANGKPVAIEISLFWGKPGTDVDPDTDAGGKVLEDDMRKSFAEREVIVFAGHSGPFYGFALANWRKTSEGDLDDADVLTMTMPSDVYQVVIAEGCDTYGLGESFRLNPAKAGAKNIDVLTTTSFSNASTAEGTKDSLRAIFGTDAAGNQKPLTWGELLRDLDSNTYYFNTMYGVHGIDDNPHAHPYAVQASLCKRCSVDTDCGGIGNKCTKLKNNEKFCTFLCTADDGCPAGYKCMSVATGSTISSSQCAPTNLTCTDPPPVPAGPAVIINEVFASPKATTGDANGDGTVSATNDEFVELVNISGKDVDLSGWKLADSAMTRFTFPQGTFLGAGKVLVVFGGGTVDKVATATGAQCVASTTNHLGLNNTGDLVKLSDSKGSVVDKMLYASDGGAGVSLVREKDGDLASKFVPHPNKAHSAGLKQDGTKF